MNNATKTIGLCFLFCASGVALAENAADVPRRWTGGFLDPAVVRAFVADAIKDNVALREVVGTGVENVLPNFYVAWYPSQWGNWQATGFAPRRSFLTLGEWRLIFGEPDRFNTEGLSHSEHVLRVVRLLRKEYAEKDGEIVRCVEISLYVDENSGGLEDWRTGRVEKLQLAGWEVLEFRPEDRGTYLVGKNPRCLAAGGNRRARPGRIMEMRVRDDAFVGHVEKLVPGVNLPSPKRPEE